MMTTQKLIELARKHVGNGAAMDSSARLCLADAVSLNDKGDLVYAAQRALKSLGYSVGILHADYAKALHFVQGVVNANGGA
jgi:hypothetical protein